MEKYNHNHSEQKKELDYENLPPMEQLQIDHAFMQSDFSDFVKKVKTIVEYGRSIESENGTANIILNKLESIINENK
jgi:hypothetical protein